MRLRPARAGELSVGELVVVSTIFDKDVMEWIDCEKCGIILEFEEHDTMVNINNRYVTLLINGIVVENDYIETDLIIPAVMML